MRDYQLHPLGLLVTSKMRWIVLRNVDIGGLAVNTLDWVNSREAVAISSAPNPYSAGRDIFFVRPTGRPETVASINHSSLNASFHGDSSAEFLDVLDQECSPASSIERMDLIHRMDSFRCPYFDRHKGRLVEYLARQVSSKFDFQAASLNFVPAGFVAL